MNYKILEKKLINYIEAGKKQFAIYPFGHNGLSIKKYLQEYFDIEPIMIIDNKYSKYNRSIYDGEFLKKHYQEAFVIILTVEDEQINRLILNELLEYVSLSNIINILDCSFRWNEDISKFKIENFLPNQSNVQFMTVEDNQDNEKIRVRVLSSTRNAWNSLSSICQAFQDDEMFEVLVITGIDMGEEHKKYIKKAKFEYIDSRNYQIAEDRPNILIVNHPYDTRTELGNVHQYCKLVVVASMQLIRYKQSMKEFWDLQQKGFGRYNPDYYLFDSLMFREIEQSSYMSERIVEMGNAKYDGIFHALRKKEYGRKWDKLKKKKVILWATDHGVYDGKISHEQTFDIFAKCIFEYFSKHPDVGLIFRPHPTLIGEMFSNGLWSNESFQKLTDYCNESENIVFDISENYNQAYSLADGIITDAYCGVICSALATRKPICLTYRTKNLKPLHEELSKCFYSAYSEEELKKFIENIKQENDRLLPLREEASKKFIKNFDGKNGYRIKEFIKKKYMSD